MGWQTIFAAILQAGNTTIINSAGTFVYNGTPAAGNLIASITPLTGVDAEGNHYNAGMNVYALSTAIGFFGPGGAAEMILYSGSLSTGWNPNAEIGLSGPSLNITTSTGVPGMIINADGVKFSPGANPNPEILSGSSQLDIGSDLVMLPANDLYATRPGTTDTLDNWNPMTLINSWANNAGYITARYRKIASPPNSVEVIGVLNAAAATSGIFFTVPAAYVPPNTQPVTAAGANAGVGAGLSPWIRIDNSGNLSVQNTGAVPGAFIIPFHGTYTLDT